MNVKGNHPLAEIIAKCMSGVETVPKEVMRRMVNRACREAVKYHEAALQSHNSENKPCRNCGSTAGTYSMGEQCLSCHCEA